MEQVAEAIGDAPRWFQLYWVVGPRRSPRASCGEPRRQATGRSSSRSTRSCSAGVRATSRNTYLPFIQGEGCAQFFTDPVFRELPGGAAGGRRARGGGADALDLPQPGADLGRPRLAARADRPAAPRQGRAHRRGCAGGEAARRRRRSIVSNHGGRQVDGAVAALDALVEVRDALGDDATVLVDSGIRAGADVVKAMALGAGRRPARPTVRLGRSRSAGRRASRRDPAAPRRDRPDARARGRHAPSVTSTEARSPP